MLKSHHPDKRRKYLVKKDFQIKFILKFCLLILAGVIASTCILFIFSQDTLTSTFHNSRLVIKNTGVAILPSVIYTNLITMGFITLAAIAVTLLVSHKIVGPLFRFEKELKNIGDGNLTTIITIREKDQIPEMADSINQMVCSLHKKMLDVQKKVDGICESAAAQDTPESLVDELNNLQENIKNNFKI
jgi:methyl-accepting chemotaxis protein